MKVFAAPTLAYCLVLASLMSVDAARRSCGASSTTTTPSTTPVATPPTIETETPPVTTEPPSTHVPTSTPESANEAPSSNSSGSSFTRFLDASTFAATFPDAVALYDFDELVNAAADLYPAFANSGDDDADKRELAAFLAQTAHESDSFKAAEEYAADTYTEAQYCDTSTGVECIAGHRYHGRGPIQLSWNYNYDAAGKALGLDLLREPEVVGSDSATAWSTGLWYWMTPQKEGLVIHEVVTQTDGFATSTDIINGALECGGTAMAKEQQRIAYYEDMCALLGVEPLGKTSCNE